MFLDAMPLAPHRSTLYRLVEAGQLARLALLAPMTERGLEPGDDALVFGLADPAGVSRDDLVAYTGLDEARLDERLRTLEDRGFLLRLAVGPGLVPGARLTPQGRTLHDALALHWDALESDLKSALGKPGRKSLRHALKAIVATLAPDQG